MNAVSGAGRLARRSGTILSRGVSIAGLLKGAPPRR
jgi:hypothetical protein